jgi:hypothetical protein
MATSAYGLIDGVSYLWFDGCNLIRKMATSASGLINGDFCQND